MCLLNVFMGTIFSLINLKLKRDILVRIYTVHQSMHKWQLVFLSHYLFFFFFYKFFILIGSEMVSFIQNEQHSTLPKNM